MGRSPSGPALIATGAAALHTVPVLAAHAPCLSNGLGIVRQLIDPATVALTFDDGPHPDATPRALAILADHGARATFFLVGERVRRHPGLCREIVAAGHAVALHGDTHRCELRLSPRALARDRARGLDIIHEATGVHATLHRPPYGAASAAGLLLARRAGLATVLWSRWGRDWRARATPATVAADVLREGPPSGAIVLLHDADHYGARGCWRATIGALPRILTECGAAGLSAVILGDGYPASLTSGDEPVMSRTEDHRAASRL